MPEAPRMKGTMKTKVVAPTEVLGSEQETGHIINVSAERFRSAEVSFQEFGQVDKEILAMIESKGSLWRWTS